MRAGLGPAPTKGPGAAGLIVQAPLKRGLSPPKAVAGGFSSPAGAAERGGGRNPPSRLRRATSLFKGGFWRADNVRPYEGARRGRRAPRMGSSIPKPCPRTDGAQRRGRQGIRQTRKPPPRTPSSRPSAESPAPHPTAMPGGMCQARRTPRGQRPPASTQGRPQWAGRGSGDHSIPPRR